MAPLDLQQHWENPPDDVIKVILAEILWDAIYSVANYSIMEVTEVSSVSLERKEESPSSDFLILTQYPHR